MSKLIYSKTIRDTLITEGNAILQNAENKNFIADITRAAEIMKSSTNRVIATGMGKSGLIARKVAATLTSTGTPSVFLHPADALHGDMGNIQKGEVVLAFSNSGETREIIVLLKYIRLLGAKLVSITGKNPSTLHNEADVGISYILEKEGCPLNLAPMASTTISMAIGDALSACLIKMKNFKPQDFGRFHPSGSLGKKLLTKVSDVMQPVDKAIIDKSTLFKGIVSAMVSSNLGAVLVEGTKGHLRGIITDGDLKRLLEQADKSPQNIWKQNAETIMTHDPLVVFTDDLVEKALAIMHDKKTYILPAVNRSKKPMGLVRMHDLVGY